jgi:hypothetical protein
MTDNACDTRIGVQFILLAVFVMSMQAIAMKAVSSDMSIWQLTVLRSLIVIPVLVVLGIRLAPFNWYRMRSLHWVALRSACIYLLFVTSPASCCNGCGCLLHLADHHLADVSSDSKGAGKSAWYIRGVSWFCWRFAGH